MRARVFKKNVPGPFETTDAPERPFEDVEGETITFERVNSFQVSKIRLRLEEELQSWEICFRSSKLASGMVH